MFPRGKGCRFVGLTTLPPSCADCLEIWEPQTPGTLRACSGLYWYCFTFYLNCYNWLPEDKPSDSKHVLVGDCEQFRLTEVHFVGLHYMIISQCTAQITKYDNSFGILSKLHTVWLRNKGLDSPQYQQCFPSPCKPTPAHQSTQPPTEGVQGPLLP
jgi:hypothetical protein